MAYTTPRRVACVFAASAYPITLAGNSYDPRERSGLIVSQVFPPSAVFRSDGIYPPAPRSLRLRCIGIPHHTRRQFVRSAGKVRADRLPGLSPIGRLPI